MKNIVVLGAGLVGSAIAIDLKKSGFNVTACDKDPVLLNKLSNENGISTQEHNLADPANIASAIQESDLVIGALPGSLGFQALKSVIESKKDVVDISFCSEDYFQLDALAKRNNVTAIVDFGVAPGMCNAILGYEDTHMQVESYKCIVGGLPVKRTWPFEYKASWSPRDVIEEYTRPARLKENGKVVIKPALSEMELVDFKEVGTLEEWNSDGLRSLLATMPHIPNMVEKTLRYPGSMEFMKMLRYAGFFSEKEITVDGKKIKPVDVAAKLLLPAWQLEEGEEEYTVMRVTIQGVKNAKAHKIVYDLYDTYSPETNTSSMARTTGYTCTGAAQLLLSGRFTGKGIIAPEMLGANGSCFQFLLKHLKERNVFYKRSASDG